MSEIESLKLAEAKLLVMNGDQRGKSVLLNKPKVIIGRELDCGLQLTDPLCSRHHAVIVCDAYTVRIRDLGSLNGTYVNKTKIETTTMLNESDQVQIGTTVMVVLRDDAGDNHVLSEEKTAVASASETKILF